jgi:competence protein ComEC
MLDVGQGDCSVVLVPDDRVVVFDCADDDVLRKVLEDWQIRTIEAFVLSHLDLDHVGGALGFLREFKHEVRHVYMSTDRDLSDAHEGAKRAKALVDHVVEHSEDEGARSRRWELLPNTRDQRPIAEGVGWSVTLLAPPYAQVVRHERGGDWEQANRWSSILSVRAGGKVMLIGGDAPLRSWSQLPDRELKAAVLRIPHHGGRLDDGEIPAGWDVARLYREVAADTALVSVGTNNQHGHPEKNWIQPVTGGACRLLCTQVTGRCHGALDVAQADGSVARDAGQVDEQRARVITQHNQWTIPQYRHLTDKRRQVRSCQLEVPCAGSVMIKLGLDGQIDVLPLPGGGHERIVDDWDHPLCRA